MALKAILDTVDGIPDVLKAEYKKGSDGKFHLDVEGGEDTGALKRAKDHEKNLRVAAEGQVAALTTQLEAATAAVTTVTGERDAALSEKGADVAAIEASWKDKVGAAEKERDTLRGELTTEIERLLVTNTSLTMAGEISTVPELFQDVISKRLKVEKGADGKYFTRVLDAAGAPSASNLDDLKKELLANEKYAAIIISGKGSGGGAGGSGSGGGAAEKKWLEYSDTELIELRKTDPDKYDRLREAHKNAPAA